MLRQFPWYNEYFICLDYPNHIAWTKIKCHCVKAVSLSQWIFLLAWILETTSFDKPILSISISSCWGSFLDTLNILSKCPCHNYYFGVFGLSRISKKEVNVLDTITLFSIYLEDCPNYIVWTHQNIPNFPMVFAG